LGLINNGYDDFQKLREETDYSWRQVDYSLEKLEDAELVNVSSGEGYVERVVSGQKRRFKAPRQIEITEEGSRTVEEFEDKSVSKEALKQDASKLRRKVADLRKQRNDILQEVVSGVEHRKRYCFICGERNQNILQEHHIIPRRFGGEDQEGNTVTLCANCHEAIEKIYDNKFFEKLKSHFRES